MLTALLALVLAADDLTRLLAFEGPHEGRTPTGWGGGPDETISVDDQVVHGGTWSARLERDSASSGAFTSLTNSLPLDVAGSTLEIRGWLRTEDVSGWAGFWLREDGRSVQLEFENMESRGITGTTDWAEYGIELPLNPRAKDVVFGILLVGQGRAWADDLQLLVDGRPIDEAPGVERVENALDTDHEFDESSGLAELAPAPAQMESLFVLGKVWGFLKYHHPRIARGEVHWDYELFRVLPALLAATDAGARDAELVAWIARLGEVPPCEPCAELPADAHLLPELDWIRDLAGKELGDALAHVHRNRLADGDQFFVGQVPGVGNPDFANEHAYTGLPQVDAGYRLLALFRLWNIIEYWFPYRDVIGEDWDGVLREFIPRLAAADGHDAYALELLALIARVNDTHANLWSSLHVRPPRGTCALPVGLRSVEGRIVVTHPAMPDGLRQGDLLLELDGTPVSTLFEQWAPLYAASNEPTRLRDMAGALTQGPCGAVRLLVERDGKEMELLQDRVPSSELDLSDAWHHDRRGETFQRLSDEIAYLSLGTILAADIPAHLAAADGARGLVIDIRNYPGEFVVFALGQHLVRRPAEFVRFTSGDLSNPGAFTWGEPLVLLPVPPVFEGQVAILVDEVSQSQAEYTAMALRTAPGAIVVGSTTAGADGNVSVIPLPGGHSTMISGIGVFYPDRTPTQRVGIVPDVVVRPTLAGIRDGRDEVLEEALRRLLGPDADEAGIREMSRR